MAKKSPRRPVAVNDVTSLARVHPFHRAVAYRIDEEKRVSRSQVHFNRS